MRLLSDALLLHAADATDSFPVKEIFLEEIGRMLRNAGTPDSSAVDETDDDLPPINFDLLELLITRVSRDAQGSGILVFLPGLGEIMNLAEVRLGAAPPHK